MNIEIIKLDTVDCTFQKEFTKYKDEFLTILLNSYQSYYGDDYQIKRLIEGKSVIYLALVDDKLVGVSYIKRNLRRGGTAVFPEEYRRKGIAENLVKESLKLFPKQYSILRVDNYKMLSLMEKLGFKKAKYIHEIENIVQDGFSQLFDFENSGEYLIFKRHSIKREVERERVTLVHTF